MQKASAERKIYARDHVYVYELYILNIVTTILHKVFMIYIRVRASLSFALRFFSSMRTYAKSVNTKICCSHAFSF
jgi:hypothetical protein